MGSEPEPRTDGAQLLSRVARRGCLLLAAGWIALRVLQRAIGAARRLTRGLTATRRLPCRGPRRPARPGAARPRAARSARCTGAIATPRSRQPSGPAAATAAAGMALRPDDLDEEEDMGEVFVGMEEGEIEGEVLDDLNDGGGPRRCGCQAPSARPGCTACLQRAWQPAASCRAAPHAAPPPSSCTHAAGADAPDFEESDDGPGEAGAEDDNPDRDLEDDSIHTFEGHQGAPPPPPGCAARAAHQAGGGCRRQAPPLAADRSRLAAANCRRTRDGGGLEPGAPRPGCHRRHGRQGLPMAGAQAGLLPGLLLPAGLLAAVACRQQLALRSPPPAAALCAALGSAAGGGAVHQSPSTTSCACPCCCRWGRTHTRPRQARCPHTS